MKPDPGQLSLLRVHDLPPRWDGHAVTWRGWEPPIPVYVCPPRKVPDCCHTCGSIEVQVGNVGRVDGLMRLRVFRCVDCKHDLVWDTDTDLWWDLDDTDYTDAGSEPPAAGSRPG